MLSRCIVNQDVVMACLSHALSTEKEEVMGLLLGRFLTEKKIAFVERSFVLSRKDKKRDRVEVSYDHLAIASTVAEELSRIDKRDDARVVGWYHSHPHITVHPSHVDVKTQGQYQALGDWLGLIFSVFDKGRLEICAFQSVQNRNGSWDRVEIPVTVMSLTAVPPAYEAFRTNRRMLESLPAMQQNLLNEEKETFEENMRSNGGLLDTSRLGVGRALSIYHSALLRLVDVQLCPLLQALRSKKASLEIERIRLLKLLENGTSSGSATASTTNNSHPPTTIQMMVDDSSSSSIHQQHQQQIHHTSFEDSKLAREALEMTIPRYSQGMNALSTAFAGFKAILMSSSTGIGSSVSHASSSSGSSSSNNRTVGNTVGISKLQKGDTYIVSIERNCPARFGQSVVSPWLLVFRSDDDATEVEDHVAVDVSLPLMRVHRCDQDGCSIELTVYTGVNLDNNSNNVNNSSSSSSSSSKNSNNNNSNEHKLSDMRLKLLPSSQTAAAGMGTSNPYHRPHELATLLGEHLHSALRLHLWSAYRPSSSVISLV